MTSDPLQRLVALMPPGEESVARAAALQLCDCLAAATGTRWSLSLSLPQEMPPPAKLNGAIIVDSLSRELSVRDEPIAVTRDRWRARLAAYAAAGCKMALICTIFRHVADPGERGVLLERIRRLNLLAAELSRETGVGVVDIDRLFALFGARWLHSDYRLSGAIAAEVAGHAIVTALFTGGLDGWVPAEVEHRAKAFHGELSDIPAIVERRLRAAAGGAA
jgi:hypothetical protein